MVRCFRDICLVCCAVFLVSGVEMLFGLVPFKTCPLFGLLFVVLSFFLRLLGCSSTPFLVFSHSLSLSLSLSLSGAGEPQTPAGFVFPLVFLRPGRGLRLRPVPLHLLLHQGFAPHLFFFCFSPSLVFWWWLFLGCGGCFRPLLLGGSGALCVLADTLSAPSRRGKCCPFFSFCVFRVWLGVFVVFSVLLFLGSLFENFFGSELLFSGVGVGRVFFGGFLPMFLLYFLAVRSRKCLENSLDVRSVVFWVRSLFLCFFFSSSSFSVFVFFQEI